MNVGEFCIGLLHLSARSCPVSEFLLHYPGTSLKQNTEDAEIQAPWWKHCLLFFVLHQTQTHPGSLIYAEFYICLCALSILCVCFCVCVLFYFPGWLRMSEPVAFHHLAAGNFVTWLFLGDQTLDSLPPTPPTFLLQLTSFITSHLLSCKSNACLDLHTCRMSTFYSCRQVFVYFWAVFLPGCWFAQRAWRTLIHRISSSPHHADVWK